MIVFKMVVVCLLLELSVLPLLKKSYTIEYSP